MPYSTVHRSTYFENCNFTQSLEDQVARFLEVDTVDHTHKPLTADEITSEKHFVKTHSRAADGRFIVRLPFRCETDHLGPSKETAIKRFESVEHKFNKQPKFREQYSKPSIRRTRIIRTPG
jgi:hypothetical protein